jgi:diadenosine tetraphosphate (Ap4A) HIT family hydrolase
MSTLFTRILNGEIPGRFVWREPDVAAFLTTGPLADGHALVVPTEEVDRWTDASPETLAKVMEVARRIGAVQLETFPAERAGLIVAGYEINHFHVHVWPSNSMADFDFASADQNPDPAVLDANAEKLREGLRAAGYAEFVPESP